MLTTISRPFRIAHAMRGVAVVTLLGALLGGCVPATSDGGDVIISTEDRIFEIRTARVALAEPVPALVAEVDRLVAAVETVWTTGDDARARAQLAGTLDVTPLQAALADLVAAGPLGDGPDMVAARAAVGQIEQHVEQLVADTRAEIDEFGSLPAFDAQIAEILAGWDASGSRSQQLAAFEALGEQAVTLAAELRALTESVPCTGVYVRRAAAVDLLGERTAELRALVSARQGNEFDVLRREYKLDPLGLGSSLGAADAAAASACWAQASPVADAADGLVGLVDALAATLDPADLQG